MDALHAIGAAHTRRGPVFVVGFARSGTSVTCRMLLNHLKVSFGTESQFIIRFLRRLPSYGDLAVDANALALLRDIARERFFLRSHHNWGFVFDPQRALGQLPERTYASVLDAIFSQLAHYRGMARWGDKTPAYYQHLPDLRRLFPDAQFVHVVRDGRDVALSIERTDFGPKNAARVAEAWSAAVQTIRRFADGLSPAEFLEVRYEDLTACPAEQMQRLADFLGIADEEGRLREHLATRVAADLRGENFGKWRRELRLREVERFEALAGQTLVDCGYDLEFEGAARPVSAGERLYWRVHDRAVRLTRAGHWADSAYKLGLRARAAAQTIRRAAGAGARPGG
jgi:hypothetical protein